MTWSPNLPPSQSIVTMLSVSAPQGTGCVQVWGLKAGRPHPGRAHSSPCAPTGVGRHGPCWGGAGSPGASVNVSLVLQHLPIARACQRLRVPPRRAQATCPQMALWVPCHQTLAPALQPPRAPTGAQGHVRVLVAWPAPPATPPRAHPGQQVRLTQPTCVPSMCLALP